MGQRWTNDGQLIETDSGGGWLKDMLGKGGNLLKAAFAAKYPEVSNLLSGENSVLSGDNSTLAGTLTTDIGSDDWMNRNTGYSANQTSSDYQTTTGFDPDFFLKDTINFDTKNVTDDVVVEQKDDVEQKLNVLDVVTIVQFVLDFSNPSNLQFDLSDLN